MISNVDFLRHLMISFAGTFLANNEGERRAMKAHERTASLWSFVNRPEVLPKYLNPMYEPNQRVIWPSVAPMSLVNMIFSIWTWICGCPDEVNNTYQHYCENILYHIKLVFVVFNMVYVLYVYIYMYSCIVNGLIGDDWIKCRCDFYSMNLDKALWHLDCQPRCCWLQSENSELWTVYWPFQK